MTNQSKKWKRNTEGLRRSAQEKAEVTKQRVEAAISLLLKDQCTVNFKTVSETARVSTAWLYANEPIKMRIIHLRSQQVPKAQVHIPPREQASNASKDAMIGALQKRVKMQEKEIRELRKQLEVASGHLQRQYLEE